MMRLAGRRRKVRAQITRHVYVNLSRACLEGGGAEVLIKVFDWDRGARDDPMGQVTIPVASMSAHGAPVWYPLSQIRGMKATAQGQVRASTL